jgi:hypothetical protein
MVKHWAFAADLISTTIGTEFTNLLSQALSARFGDLSPPNHRSDADQDLDAVALEVVAPQEAQELAAL